MHLLSSISPTAAQAQSYSSITITQSEEVTSTSLEEIKYSELDKNENIPGSSNLCWFEINLVHM